MKKQFSNSEFLDLFEDRVFKLGFDITESRWNSYPLFKKDSDEHKDQIFFESFENLEDTSSHLAVTDEKIYQREDDHEAESEYEPESSKIEQDSEFSDHSYESGMFNIIDLSELLNLVNNPTTDLNALLSDVLSQGK